MKTAHSGGRWPHEELKLAISTRYTFLLVKNKYFSHLHSYAENCKWKRRSALCPGTLCLNATDVLDLQTCGHSLKHTRPAEDSKKQKRNKTQQNHQRQRERERKKITILCTEFTCKKLDTSRDTRGSALVHGWGGPTRSTFILVRTPGHNSHGPEVFTCLLYFGGKGTCCLCHFFVVVIGWFAFFFWKYKEIRKKKSLPTFLQETKFPRKVRYGSLSIYRNRF